MTRAQRDRLIARVLDKYPDLSPLASGYAQAEAVSVEPE